MYNPNYDLRRSVLDDRHGGEADYVIATSRACIAEGQRRIEHSIELIAEIQATIDRSRALLGAIAPPQPLRLIVPAQSRVAEEETNDGVWSWRAALLLMFSWCLFAWIGIGFLVASLID